MCHVDSNGDGGNIKKRMYERFDPDFFLYPHDGVFCWVSAGWQLGDQVQKIGQWKSLDRDDVHFPTITGTCADGMCIIWQGGM